MKLRVPQYMQEKGSSDCGHVCIQMILEYFGQKECLQKIKKEITVKKDGTYAYQLGTFCLKQGYKVSIVTQNPFLFSVSDRDKSQKALYAKIVKPSKDPSLKQKGKQILYLIEFMKECGVMTVAVPSYKHIKKNIDQKNPLIALCTTQFVTDKISKCNFHFLTIVGYTAKNIIANDPDGRKKEVSSQRKITKEDFFYGLHASSAADIDNGSLLTISK